MGSEDEHWENGMDKIRIARLNRVPFTERSISKTARRVRPAAGVLKTAPASKPPPKRASNTSNSCQLV